MVWALVIGLMVAGACSVLGWLLRPGTSAAPRAVSTPPAPRESLGPSVESEEARFLRQVEGEAARIQLEIGREARRIEAEALVDAHRTGLDGALSSGDEDPDSAPRGNVTCRDFVAKEDEQAYLRRDAEGLPTLRFVDAGDRLSIWSPEGGGALINPKGPGLRRLGLFSSYVRGAEYHAASFRNADLSMGRWVDLRREPDNKYDSNAITMSPAGSAAPVGYVQRGRAPAVARRMDAGEDMAAVSLRGPDRGLDEHAAFVLIGNRADLRAMLQV